jgi:hypothetical protein
MKTTTKKPAPRTYLYAAVAYYGRSIDDGIPVAWTFRSTSISAAKRKANRIGLGGRDIMTARAADRLTVRPVFVPFCRWA